jgi:hypothetical protein
MSRQPGSATTALPPITLLDIGMSNDGHRSDYVDCLSRLFTIDRRPPGIASVFSARPALVPSIEESLAIYALVALVRAILGRRTVGLLLRPGPVVTRQSLRHRLKGLILRVLRRVPRVHTLTILPFTVEPGFAAIADGWIYDLQLWDLTVGVGAGTTADAHASTLGSDVRAIANGRPVCSALGRQVRDKGFDWFADLYVASPALRQAALFVVGGRISADLQDRRQALEQAGGHVCDRLISNRELLDLYAVSDLVWCAYAPDYDQASGILGRATQMGIPVVVRSGSLIHRLCTLEGFPHVAIDAEADGRQLAAPPPRDDPDAATARARRFAAASIRQLRQALGITA